MRCWHPRAVDVIKKVKKYNPEEIILLPLYPQFSASTSGSSINEWNDLCKKENYKIKTKTICCYPTESNFIESHISLIKKTLQNLKNDNLKLIFSTRLLLLVIIKPPPNDVGILTAPVLKKAVLPKFPVSIFS